MSVPVFNRHQELLRACALLKDQIMRLPQYDLPRMTDDYVRMTLRINQTLRDMQMEVYEIRAEVLGDRPMPLVNDGQNRQEN